MRKMWAIRSFGFKTLNEIFNQFKELSFHEGLKLKCFHACSALMARVGSESVRPLTDKSLNALIEATCKVGKQSSCQYHAYLTTTIF